MDSFVQKLALAHRNCPECPSAKVIHLYFEDLLGLLFPDFTEELLKDPAQIQQKVEELKCRLGGLLIKNKHLHQADGGALAEQFFTNLEAIYELILQDVQAMFDGDPAAKSVTEVIRCYPGFYAITAYRVAHGLHKLGIALIPRMITEFAHSKTGIDIHPGASIGPKFCIDHGTGIVIGETTTIGECVKIYQGVTLGALSVDKVDADKKRHPTIEDHVVIYAGATILGGNTVIGKHSIVGGNVWLTKSIPPHSKVYYQANMQDPSGEHRETYIIKT
ncbi:serine O-acetyltransferase [Mongoliitalea lutea]|uniref:Serine acetyltransferase n=1 Tax=Mongoliitalea lutea TaxID=849756 RepID=A0A8J3CWC5_9BACT|nr:serine O-acetyltransferase [Mongoliitalea lutea]GHB35547.1 hypothetical protein GCM10008106_16290 [Mongoliitalea lutea]